MERSLSRELLRFFHAYLIFYQDFLRAETEKLADLENGRLEALESHIKAEEAYMLRSRGLEAEKETLLSRTERPKAVFRELIPLIPAEDREEMQLVYEELSRVIRELRDTNRRCNALTQRGLRSVEQSLARLEKRDSRGGVYTPAGGEAFTGMLSKKV